MKLLATIIALSIFSPLTIVAQQSPEVQNENFVATGKTFLHTCEDRSRGIAVLMGCLTYVVGVTDGAEMPHGFADQQQLFCVPVEVENLQKLRIALKYMHDHPEKDELQARQLIVMAMEAAFPCSRK